uniref:Uncharacterized protein n=1 Tax=Physcomitrium patens TaxID=3218 RepID=A0A7I3YUQ4_PHYPA
MTLIYSSLQAFVAGASSGAPCSPLRTSMPWSHFPSLAVAISNFLRWHELRNCNSSFMSRASSPRIPREEFDHHKLIYQNSKAEDSSQFKDTSLLIYGVREMEWRISKQG